MGQVRGSMFIVLSVYIYMGVLIVFARCFELLIEWTPILALFWLFIALATSLPTLLLIQKWWYQRWWYYCSWGDRLVVIGLSVLMIPGLAHRREMPGERLIGGILGIAVGLYLYGLALELFEDYGKAKASGENSRVTLKKMLKKVSEEVVVLEKVVKRLQKSLLDLFFPS